LLFWEEGIEQGRDTPAEELCRDCPDLLPALRADIAGLKRVGWLKERFRSDDFTRQVRRPLGSPVPQRRPPPLPLVLGRRCRLCRLIAEGGSGQVWRGFDLNLQRKVAVKVPRPDKLSAPTQVDAYLNEARRAAQLHHPGIVSVYDVALHDGGYFIVSALI